MKIKIAVGVPCFNNQDTVYSVLSELLLTTSLDVFLVDDGSDIPVTKVELINGFELNQDLGKIESDFNLSIANEALFSRLHIFRFEQNKGKGAALQFLFKMALAKGYTHILTMDSDGQHFVNDCKKLIQEAVKDPMAMIVGCRDFEKSNAPNSSRFGRKFSNFWVHYETGKTIRDSQSGFRVYPLFFAQNMNFYCTKFDFEIEVLVRMLWEKVAVKEVVVGVKYPQDRVSHFDKFSDNLRLTVLNSALTILSMFRKEYSSFKIAISLALGVFVGCTPFFGFHALIAIALGAVFGLSVPVALIGTQVSLPIFAPFLISAAIAIGNSWLVGSFIVAVALASFSFLVLYLILKRREKFSDIRQQSKINSKPSWAAKTNGRQLGSYLLKLFADKFGLKFGIFLLHFVVPYYFVFSRRARSGSLQLFDKLLQKSSDFSLRTDMGARTSLVSALKKTKFVYRNLFSFATILLEKEFVQMRWHALLLDHDQNPFRIVGKSPSSRTGVVFNLGSEKLILEKKFFNEGTENFIETIFNPIEKQGCLFVSSHFGGWQISNLSGQMEFLEFKNFKTVQYVFSPQVQSALQPKDVSNNVLGDRIIKSNLEPNSVLQVKSILESGGLVGVMGDRCESGSFELLPFFGGLVPIDMRPFRVAVILKCPIVISLTKRVDFLKYELNLKVLNKNGEYQNAEVLAKEYIQLLEREVENAPEQWFNFYPFWSTPPTNYLKTESEKIRDHIESPVRDNRDTVGAIDLN